MRDGLGVGLAATQVGMLRRLLVFQAGRRQRADGAGQPEIEWLSDEVVVAEEGCLSLPAGLDGRRAPAARPAQRPRRRRRAGADRGLRARGAGPPARDRPPRRGPDPRPGPARPAQGARCGRCAKAAATAPPATRTRTRRSPSRAIASPAPTREDRLPRHLRVRRHRPAAPGRLPAPPAARRHPARPPPGPRPPGRCRRRPPRPRAELGIELLQAEDVNDEAGAGADPRRRARRRSSSAPSAS